MSRSRASQTTTGLRPVVSDSRRSPKSTMDLIQEYLERAKEIIGERTPGEEKYDREVVRWLAKGKDISKAIAKASEKYPAEALTVDESTRADVRAHYEYVAEYERIIQKMNR